MYGPTGLDDSSFRDGNCRLLQSRLEAFSKAQTYLLFCYYGNDSTTRSEKKDNSPFQFTVSKTCSSTNAPLNNTTKTKLPLRYETCSQAFTDLLADMY